MSSTRGGDRGKWKPATKSLSRSSKAGLQFHIGHTAPYLKFGKYVVPPSTSPMISNPMC
jgi:histone H2A